tara:strand:+ start:518 stop:736 length:219 start_codon:yes stop_codon:yes gene_type:complete
MQGTTTYTLINQEVLMKRKEVKNDEYKTYSFYLNGHLIKKLEEVADKEKRSASKQLELILENYFEDKEQYKT